MESTRITEKGQVTIPKAFREKYDLESGDEVLWFDTDEGLVVKTLTRNAGRGLLVPDDISAEKRAVVAEELCRGIRERREQYRENS
ncbi:AbrB/MazE/SpoVT family DNA-binding domain-containing protein [Halorientalis halophila]|uniref:AbrB/MazE/SpoVT family DNA-binding domain-containing protein n=1 Tax=Halorientalis halophila TaxID=3108499 RepID=UPI003009FF1E